MFAGHAGAAAAAKRFLPEVNLGWLLIAALGADILLWVLALAGIERIVVPVDPSVRRYLTFVFPYSHSLLATFLYAILAGLLAFRLRGRAAALVFAILVFSHFVLDALVHIPDLTLAGADTLRFGTSLENTPIEALALESVLTLAGLALYWPRCRNGIVGVILLTLLLTIAGTLWAPPPDDPQLAAVGPLASDILVIGLCAWFDRSRPDSAELLR